MSSRVVIFGGQGSASLFSPFSIDTLNRVLRHSPAASLFLSKCHSAFIHDVQSLGDAARTVIGLDILHFHQAHILLEPPTEYRGNGLVVATALFTAQIIQFIHFCESSSENDRAPFEHIIEATGFCAGLLPAVAVSCSRDVSQLIDFSVELFRLCFWIAYRSIEHGLSKNASNGQTVTWSLVVTGSTESELASAIVKFVEKTGHDTIQISAVSSAQNLSISGPPEDLQRFKEFLPSSARHTSPVVYSWYHGGEQLSEVVSLIGKDIEERHIATPSSAQLQLPVRSTFNNTVITSKDEPQYMGTWIARHMIMHCVQWQDTMEAVKESCLKRVEANPTLVVEIDSYGPSSSFLLSSFKDFHNRIPTVNRSCFASTPITNNISNESIAIVGASVNLPGANGLVALSELLMSGESVIKEIPADRFNAALYQQDSNSSSKRQMGVQYGAFLDDIWNFDNGFYSISPREANSMDPQQRLLMHSVQAALDSAGYVADSTPSFQRETMGCYIGLATGDYTDNLHDDIDVFYSPGTLRAFHSGRISYFYKLSGPCMTIDTACSSSLVSIAQACRALQTGDCRSAIAGGVNAITSPDMYIGLDKGHFLSHTGGCKTFDADADGYCRAEGVVVFVLKRLTDALAENDRIYGIIRDAVINQSGNSASITQPHSGTQIDLIRSLLDRAQISPATIDAVEAHGTGTQAGDTRETRSLVEVFKDSHTSKNQVVVSSIKGNIGHTEAASGAAGLAKLLVMMQNQTIYKQAGLQTINPQLPLEDDGPIRIPRANEEWKKSRDHPRRALLNNFGAAGSNSALLLEQPESEALVEVFSAPRSAYVFSLSAKSPEMLKESIKEYISTIKDGKLGLGDICYTATARRPNYDHGVTTVVSSIAQLIDQLPTVSISPRAKDNSQASCVFVFSGQGAIHPGMGMELMKTSQYFAGIIQHCDDVLTNLGFPSLLTYFLNTDSSVDNLENEIIVSQCACVALQYALARLMISWGIKPSSVVGHSLGEYAGLAICGSLSIEEVMATVARRAKLLADKCETSRSDMISVQTTIKGAREMIDASKDLSGIEIACMNSPNDTVLAGPVKELEILEEKCKSDSIKAKRLHVPIAFHSKAVDAILPELAEISNSLDWKTPEFPFYSTVFGKQIQLEGDAQGLGGEYLSTHARQMVKFADAIKAIETDGLFQGGSCVEIGPHPILLHMVQASLKEKCAAFASLRKGKDAWLTLSESLCSLSNNSAMNINWREVFASSGAKLVDLPGYPLRGKRYAIIIKEPEQGIDGTLAGINGLGTASAVLLSSKKVENGVVYTTSTDIIGHLIEGHDVGGTPICPASVFLMLATDGARFSNKPDIESPVNFMDIEFASPLVHVAGDNSQVVELFISNANDSGVSRFEVKSIKQDGKVSSHCSGRVSFVDFKSISKQWTKDAMVVKRQTNYLQNTSPEKLSRFQTRLLYDVVFPRVVRYSGEYQSLSDFRVSYDSLEGMGPFQLPRTTEADHKSEKLARWMDTLFHAPGFIANTNAMYENVYICSSIGSTVLDAAAIDFDDVFDIYCSLLETAEGSISADAWALNKDGKVVALSKDMVFKRIERSKFERHLSMSRRAPTVEGETAEKTKPQQPSKPVQRTSEPVEAPEMVVEDSPQDAVVQLVAEVSGIEAEQLEPSASLDSVGIDSMMQIELATMIKRKLSVDVEMEACDTVGAILDAVAKEMPQSVEEPPVSVKDTPESKSDNSGSGTPSTETSDDVSRVSSSGSSAPDDESLAMQLLPIQFGPKNKTPLILIPDGSGMTGSYSRITDLERNVHAIFDPMAMKASVKPKHNSVHSLASAFASLVESQTLSSVILGGWSFGGVVAFETAYQLLRRGHAVRGVILIDSPFPVNHDPLPKEIIEHILRQGKSADTKPNEALMQQFQHAAKKLGAYVPPTETNMQKAGCKVIMLQSADTFDAKAKCGVEYPWLADQKNRDEAVEKWKGLVGGEMDVLKIGGDHFEPFTAENISKTSAQIDAACKLLD